MKHLKTHIAFKLADQLAKTMLYKLEGRWFKCWLTYYFTVKPMYLVLKLIHKDKNSTLTL